MTNHSFSFLDFGVNAFLAMALVFAAQTAPWLLCVYQWWGATASLPEKDVPAYYLRCGSTPAVVIPLAISVLVGAVVASGVEMTRVYRVSRQHRGEREAMQGEPLSNREVEAMAAQHRQPAIKDYGRVNTFGERFPLVSTLAKFLRVLGFLLVVGGLGIFLIEFLPWVTCTTPKTLPQQQQFFGAPQQAGCPLAVWELGGGGAVFVIGLGIVAVGELLGMFRSIEGNTYNTMKAVQEADYKGRLAQGS